MLRTSTSSLFADEHRALQVSHIEKQESLVMENFRVTEFEGVKRAYGSELDDIYRDPRFGHRFGDLLDSLAQHSTNEVFGFCYHAVLDRRHVWSRARSGFIGIVVVRVLCANRRNIEYEILALLIEHGQSMQAQCIAE
jgi:hypothetical protein